MKTKTENTKIKKIKELWQNPRGKALLKLALWGIFFLVLTMVILIFNIFNKPKKPIEKPSIPKVEEKQFNTVESMFSRLNTLDYEFSYIITDSLTNETITFNGNKTNDSIEGYRESKIGIIKYAITNDTVYQLLLKERIVILDLYANLKEEYFNINKIAEIIKDKKPKISINNTSRLLTYEDISILSNQTNIEAIKIKENNKTYDLTFKNIKE